MKKLVPLVLIFSSLSAIEPEDRLTELEVQMKEIYLEMPYKAVGGNFAPGSPRACGVGLFVQGDMLYWHAKVGGTDYAYSDSEGNPNIGPSVPLKGRNKENRFGWDFGLRANLGYDFSPSGWDIVGRYTWYQTNSNDVTSQVLPARLIPLRDSFLILGGFHQAKSDFELNYQAGDFEMGRRTFMGSQLSIRPFIGAKGAWIDETQRIRSLIDPAHLGMPNAQLRVVDTVTFWGAGPKAGFNTKWDLCYGFNFIANASAALLYGNFDTTHRENLVEVMNDAMHITVKGSVNAFSPQAHLFLGLGWDRLCASDRCHIFLALGYDVEYYWRQNQMIVPDDGSPTYKFERLAEDVMFYGLTVKVRVDF